MPLTELSRVLRSGALDLLDYLAELEARFEAREPRVLAFTPEVGRFARLRREAERLQARFPDPQTRPALFGVPVGVKDIFHVLGFPTQAGSRLPAEVLAGPEAESVTRLKEAGALILGKTATTEFAYFGPAATRNPWSQEDAPHTPGGSSSGSAAAVAAGLAPLTLGTQTIGSIVRPASFCGVVGFKPTYDRVSRAGVIPLAPSYDHIGPFAVDVAGVKLAAAALIKDWRPELVTTRRPVLGIPRGPFLEHAAADMLTHFRATCERLRQAGYTLKAVPAMPDFVAIRERHLLAVAAEAAHVHAGWFPTYQALYHSKTAELIRRGQGVSSVELHLALKGREQLREALTGLMGEHEIDLWISPAAPGAAPRGLESTGNPVMNLPWTQAGLPSLNLPSGHNAAGLPLGLQLAGWWYGDEQLLDWASEIEAAI